jgi:hypothetical protein
MSEITLKLNLDDLKALFGGDDPPSIEFRHGIAKEIASRYIKSTVIQELETQQGKLIREEINNIMKNGFLDFDVYGKTTKAMLPQQYKDAIQLAVNEEIDSMVAKRLAEANATILKTLAELPARIDFILGNRFSDEKLQENITRYLEKHLATDIIAVLSKQAAQELK